MEATGFVTTAISATSSRPTDYEKPAMLFGSLVAGLSNRCLFKVCRFVKPCLATLIYWSSPSFINTIALNLAD